MSIALELLVFTALFALAIGLLGSFIASSDSEQRKQRAAHEADYHERQPWGTNHGDSRSKR